MRVRSNAHVAFTLVEVVVVLFVLGVILAITIPAVMSARESARRVQCLSQLKSIALSINAHLDQKNYYPREENGYSALVFMLPFLDQNSLFNSFNLALGRDFVYGPSDVNYTAYSTTVSVFVCPSEIAPWTGLGPTSYAGNLGTGVGPYHRPDNGPFASSSIDPKIRDAWVRDGLANTVAVSEICHTLGRETPRNERAVFQLGTYSRDKFETMTSDCSAIDIGRQPIAPVYRGLCWAFDGYHNTLYDHNIQPNGHTCACDAGALQGAWTASSYHPGGVNCTHLDGHVSFIRDTISISAWRALGTMAGGEVIPGNTD